jgi:HK97 family phage major capsid protein
MALNDDIVARLTEIEKAVKEGGQIDWDKVKADFETHHKAYIDQQIQEKLDSRPMRRVPGALIGADGTKIAPSNRYHKHLAAFEKDGCYQWGTSKILPIDLWLAVKVIDQAKAFFPEKVKADVSPDLRAAVKALTSTGTGTGDEYVPTGMDSGLWEDMFLSAIVLGSIMTVDMPTDPFDLPVGSGDITWRKGTQNTATTASDPTTAKSTLTSTELITEQAWSYTYDEDAVIAGMPLVRSLVTRTGGEQMDSFILNADSTNAGTGNINLDDADPPDDSYYLSDGQDGIRHLHLVDNTGQTTDCAGALTDAKLTTMLATMDKYAADPRQLAFVCDIGTYLNGFLSTATGAPGSFITTLEKLGPQGILISGMLASYRGVPILVGSQYPKSEADGKVSTTAGNNTKGGLSCYHRGMWKVGFRRQLLVEVDKLIQKRQMVMVSSFRIAVAAHGARASAKHTSGLRNITI